MATLKKYNLSGQETGTVQVVDRLVDVEVKGQMVKDYIIALRSNARQWSASTKTRSEVAHTTKKPRPQKGTGSARQGSLVGPQFRGGGIVFGPKPKFDQHVKINRKERQAVIRFLISEKIKENQILILEDTQLQEPKTKHVSKFLKSIGLSKRVLFVGEGEYETVEVEGHKTRVSVLTKKHDDLVRGMRNIPKVEFTLAMNMNGYDLLLARTIVMTEAALHEITEWLS